MYALVNQLQNLPIISLQTGQPVATATRPIINPDKLELVAFYCSFKRWQRNQAAVLLVKDIRQIAAEGIVIDSVDEIEDPNDIIRLKAVINQHFHLSGLLVANESGIRLGRVEEYTVNLQTFQIQKLYLKQSLLKNLLLDNLVIDRSQIIDISPKQIIVRDATVKKTILSPKTTPQPTPPPTA